MATKALPDVITEQWFRDTFGAPNTPQELEALGPRLAEYGLSVKKNAEGIAGKVTIPGYGPDGGDYFLDVIKAAGAGGQGFLWSGDVTRQIHGGPSTGTPSAPAPAPAPATAASSARWPVNPNTGRRQPPGTGGTPSGGPPAIPQSPNIYGSAYLAQARQRSRASAGGRRSTILAGFMPGRPSTAPRTLMGGY